MSNGYNGWSNYETWRTNLELLDGYEVSDFLHDHRFVFPDDRDKAVAELASHFEEYVQEVMDLPEGNSLALGIVQDFIARVDFEEIAEHYVDDYVNEFMYNELKELV